MTLSQVFHVGPLVIHYYGLILALAVLAAYWLARKRASSYGLSSSQVDTIAVWVIVTGFVGARLFHVLTDLEFYSNNPIQILFVWQGGLAIYGAIIGGVIGLWLAARRYAASVKLLSLLDWLAPSVLLGQIIGRFGNWFNYELFGRATDLPWKMFVPEEFRPELWASYSYFHPLFLYEAVLGTFVLIILFGYVNRRFKPGSLFFSYLLLYNVVRFFLEWYRLDGIFIGRISVNAIIAAALVIISIIVLRILRHERQTFSN